MLRPAFVPCFLTPALVDEAEQAVRRGRRLGRVRVGVAVRVGVRVRVRVRFRVGVRVRVGARVRARARIKGLGIM